MAITKTYDLLNINGVKGWVRDSWARRKIVEIQSKFCVVEGTFPSATGYTATEPYPTGFTQTNCVIVGFSVSFQGVWRTGYGAYSGSGRYFFNLDPTGVQGYVSNTYGYNESWRVVLMRTDI